VGSVGYVASVPAHLGDAARRRRGRRRRWRIALCTLVAIAAGFGIALRWVGGDDRPAGDVAAREPPATDASTTSAAPPMSATSVPDGPPDQRALDAVALRLEQVVELRHPTALVERPGTGDLYATGVEGPVVQVPAGGGEPVVVADLGPLISTEGESGLLDLAFAPGGDLAFLSLVERDGDLALIEVPVAGDRLATDRSRTVLAIASPSNVHHAGDVDVDASGLIWFSVGDGGPSQARSGRAQDLTDLHGKILRIDPRPTGSASYRIPPDNPFVGRTDVRPEIWAYGLRNPWRFEHDPLTRDLWIGDVGRNDREEIDHVVGPRAGAGANFGWPYFEGTRPGTGEAPSGLVAPVLDYGHEQRCGVTGGAVYRGTAIPRLAGAFLFSDLCDGVVRAVVVADGAVVAERAFDDVQAGYPVAFGTDSSGELYLCSFDLNAVYRIAAA
jgi:glucose/arabinose dehydrogenase